MANITGPESDKATPNSATGLLTLPAERRGPFPLPGNEHGSYVVHAEFMPASANEARRTEGTPDAAICMLSYITNNDQEAQRPVCFIFNGGPGASSAFLNVGALGPRRLVMPSVSGTRTGPARLQDNEHTLLHSADLVFIDPPNTGFSRLLAPSSSEAFSVDGDAQILVDGIRTWLDRHRRWSSPVYLCGESYGGARAAVVSDAALDQGIAVAGIMLISPALDMQPVLCSQGNYAAYALRLPSYAATAFHHQRTTDITVDSPVEAYRKVEDQLAQAQYGDLPAGDASVEQDRKAYAEKLSGLIGIPADDLLKKKFLVHPNDFSTSLLADARSAVGKMDARVVGPASNEQAGDDDDAAIDAVYAPIAMATRIVLRSELAIDWACSYEVFSHSTWGAWQWNRDGTTGNQFTASSPDLASAMRRNPAMRVWTATGRYDLITPPAATNWSLARLDIPDAARARIQHQIFESGHMIYTDDVAHQNMMVSMHQWLAPTV